MSTNTKTFEEFKEKIENILDGELRGNWEFKCSETEPCYCDGFCREFIKLKNQIIEAAELYASEKVKEHSVPLAELLAVLHKDGGHHQNNVGTEQAVKDAMVIYYSMRSQIEGFDEKIRRAIELARSFHPDFGHKTRNPKYIEQEILELLNQNK